MYNDNGNLAHDKENRITLLRKILIHVTRTRSGRKRIMRNKHTMIRRRRTRTGRRRGKKENQKEKKEERKKEKEERRGGRRRRIIRRSRYDIECCRDCGQQLRLVLACVSSCTSASRTACRSPSPYLHADDLDLSVRAVATYNSCCRRSPGTNLILHILHLDLLVVVEQARAANVLPLSVFSTVANGSRLNGSRPNRTEVVAARA
eukprot:12484401-Heterocapsa_arctica.AAC.1